LVEVIEAPVVVVVGGGTGTAEVPDHAGAVLVGQVELTNFIAVLEQNVDSVVVLSELTDSVRKRVHLFFSLINPVACISIYILKGLSSPWIAKMSWFIPCSLGQTEYIGSVLVLR